MSVADVLAVYRRRGAPVPLGMGRRPALLVIDFSLAFTRGTAGAPGADYGSELAATRRLLQAARGRVPVLYTTIAFPRDIADAAGLWGRKIPWITTLHPDSPDAAIDEEVAPAPDEPVLVKPGPSAFFGTDLHRRLGDGGVDTLILAGCTTSVCIRATAVDGMQLGYRVVLADGAVGDYHPGLHALHLADLEARYADVVPVPRIIEHLGGLAAEPGRA